MGVMKYFKHILMDHEIFFKLFDGPQNIFLCSIFIILFFKLRGLEYKISKLAILVIKKDKACQINHIYSEDKRQILVKIKKMFDAF